jgi:hypothetical protein
VGNFYVNFTTRGPDQSAVADALRAARRKGFIAPTTGGLTVFFDEQADTQDDSIVKALGSQVSRDLDAPVLAVLNHDDDILCYWLFTGGKLVDEYNSCPGYFTGGDAAPTGGDAQKLCAAFAVPAQVQEVQTILRNQDYVFALERHHALAALLQHPLDYICLGYRYIEEGEGPDGPDNAGLLRIG